ncbi:hypothetical protein GCM10025738_16020 [Microbacterium fluvii]
MRAGGAGRDRCIERGRSTPGEDPSVRINKDPEQKEGGIPWGEWDAATSDTLFGG